jgi:hypothetical protein
VVPVENRLRGPVLLVENVHYGGSGLGILELERVENWLVHDYDEQPLDILWWMCGLACDARSGCRCVVGAGSDCFRHFEQMMV